jgi:hypothetical protein
MRSLIAFETVCGQPAVGAEPAIPPTTAGKRVNERKCVAVTASNGAIIGSFPCFGTSKNPEEGSNGFAAFGLPSPFLTT